jgi:hypothetical protein
MGRAFVESELLDPNSQLRKMLPPTFGGSANDLPYIPEGWSEKYFDLGNTDPWTTRTITFDPTGVETGVFRQFDDPDTWLSQHILNLNHLAGYDEPAAENLIASLERAAIHGPASPESLPNALSYEPRFGPAYDFSEGDFNVDWDFTNDAAGISLDGDGFNGFDGSWLNDLHVDWSGDDDLFPVDFGDEDEWQFGDLIEPIVLDLDGDRVDIVAREDSPVYFNVDGDAALEKTAWAGKTDGFLVIDLATGGGAGPDGAITQLRELSFAAWTADPNDTDAQALRTAFDANGDRLLRARGERREPRADRRGALRRRQRARQQPRRQCRRG